MAQRAYVMKSGRIVLEKPAAELLERAGVVVGAVLMDELEPTSRGLLAWAAARYRDAEAARARRAAV